MSKYDDQIARGLSKAYQERAHRGAFDVVSDKWVIFSDMHRGTRDGADDFKRCEKAYNAALGYYYEKGYTLVVLGDAEELWECSPKDVVRCYRQSLTLEAQFQSQQRYLRFFGNHDSDWKRAGAVKKYLLAIYDSDLKVHECMRVRVHAGGMDLGEIFLVHGHQGTTDADQYSAISRFAVRHGWSVIQRVLNIRSTTPSKDFELRHKHNVAMYRWVEKLKDTVLIAGHTHRPVFASRNKLSLLQDALRDVHAQIGAAGPHPPTELIESAAQLRSQIEASRVQEINTPAGEAPVQQGKPCYFNTGCCSYSDGDVTALEIADGMIKLVRVPDDLDHPRPHVLASEDLRVVFNKLTVPQPIHQPA